MSKGKRRTDYDALRKALGLLRGLSGDFTEVCEEEGVPIEAIDRLITPEARATLVGMARLIKADWEAQPKPKIIVPKTTVVKPLEFSSIEWFDELVEVNYDIRPSFDELKGKWFDWADDNFRTVHPVLRSVRADAPTTGIERVRMGYLKLNRNFTDEQGLDSCKRSRLKPVIDLELVYFGKKFPEEQRKHPILEVGSFFPVDDSRRSACLRSGGGCHLRYLCMDLGSVGNPRNADCRILVRE